MNHRTSDQINGLAVTMPAILRIGDAVNWHRSYGTKAAQRVLVVAIMRVDSKSDIDSRQGDEVDSMPWSEVPEHAVVDLENGQWAYGYQLEPVEQ